MADKVVKYFFIHGAWSSPACFNYLKDKINTKYETTDFSYDCQNSRLEEIVHSASELLYQTTRPGEQVVVVGHSLGGLVALALEKEPKVSRVVTIASPLKGIRMNRIVAEFLAYRAPILRHLVCGSSFLNKLHSDHYTKPLDVIVATRGFNPMIGEPNDGVLTIDCQEGWVPPTARLSYIPATHFDVLQHEETVKQLIGNGK